MKKLVIYQVSDDIEIEKFLELKSFAPTRNIKAKDLQIKVFAGYDNETFVDALEIVDYLSARKIFRHDALNKNQKDLKKALNYLFSLVIKEKYDVLFLITYYDQANILPKMIAKHFNAKRELKFTTVPGVITCFNLENKKFSMYTPNTILN
jgi:hypothetical protein